MNKIKENSVRFIRSIDFKGGIQYGQSPTVNKRNPLPPVKFSKYFPSRLKASVISTKLLQQCKNFEADYVRLLLTKPPKNMIQTKSGMK